MDSVKCMLTHLIPSKHTCHYPVNWLSMWQFYGETLGNVIETSTIIRSFKLFVFISVGETLGSVIGSGVK